MRTRTRFSIFELWYQKILKEKAFGNFGGWDNSALSAVTPGGAVEITSALQIIPLQTLLRLFRWFAAQTQDQNSPFAQKGEELEATKGGLKTLEALLDGTHEVLAMLLPESNPGPAVAVVLGANWLIGALGRLDGTYTVIAQTEIV